MITFTDAYLQSASVNSAYNAFISVSGGTAPYSFAVTTGSLPPGITMSAQGQLSGQAQTLGTYTFTVQASDSSTPAQTAIKSYTLIVLDLVQLNLPTVDQDQFVQQFQAKLATSGTWSYGLATQTSQTLIEYVSAVGTLMTAKIVRAVEDAFPETAQSDSAIRAIVNMQGLRISRMLPAAMQITATSNIAQTIPPFTQWSAGGYSWFNSQPVVFQPNVAQTVTLKEGQVVTNQVTGLGTDLQAWISNDDQFTVSDQDVVVSIGSQDLYKTFGPLWNYQGIKAYSDLTLSNGRLVVQFGAQGYGAVPSPSDVVTIVYAKTQGATVNGANLAGARVTCAIAASSLTATVVSNPSGGADTKPTVAYKNFAAGSFGTYSSGVTKAQYSSLVNNYPGIIDAYTQAQREINPSDVKWMNVIRVSALTSSPWTQQQVQDFTRYMQSVTMYSPQFVWQAPVPIPRDVEMEIYCYNSVNSLSDTENTVEAAIQALFAPRAGILMTNFYNSDLERTAFNAVPGQISYIIIKEPTSPMIVTAPLSPQITYTVIPSGGSLSQLLYSYSVSVDAPSPSQWLRGLINASTNPSWPVATEAGEYWVISVAGTVAGNAVAVGDQVLATSPTTFTIVPEATNGVIDVGVPANWVNPEVTQSGSRVQLDWSANPVQDALRYHLWGRRAGYLGILATLPATQTAYTDVGGPDPTPQPVGVQSDTLIRYNSLNSLKVTAFYANRQNNVLLPVRNPLG